MIKKFLIAAITIFAFSNAAIAEDWVVSKLRGGVFLLKAGQWMQLERGQVISDNSAIQTAKGAKVLLARGKETIDIAGDTRVKISDKGSAMRTIVYQDYGSLIVDVEKKDVQHFEVQTPLLAAVVKGTKFEVKSGRNAASVSVMRGRVETRDPKAGLKVDTLPGQKVKLDKVKDPFLRVSGRGEKQPIRLIKNNKVVGLGVILELMRKTYPDFKVDGKLVREIAKQQGKDLSRGEAASLADEKSSSAKASSKSSSANDSGAPEDKGSSGDKGKSGDNGKSGDKGSSTKSE